jgi:hypothetical protein
MIRLSKEEMKFPNREEKNNEKYGGGTAQEFIWLTES